MYKISEIINSLTTEQLIDIGLACFIIVIFRILSSLISELIIRILRPKNIEKKERKSAKENPFYKPIRTVITFIGIFVALNILKDSLNVSAEGINIIKKIIKITMYVYVAKAFGEWLDVRDGIVDKLKNKKDGKIKQETNELLYRTIKVAVYILAGFLVISELGYNLSGLVTGLGISGIVITLAAQDTAKSIIGGISILVDKPFKIGDFIRIGEYEGTVEDIKFRTTNIRTLENSVLHIPNSEMSVLPILNYSEIKHRRYVSELVLELDTSINKIQKLKSKIIEMLEVNEYVVKNSEHVYFKKISDNGMSITIMAYLHESDFYKALEIKEMLNYNVLNILNKEKIELAYDTQTVYIKNES